MDIKFVKKYEPSTVKIEVEFDVHDPAKIIRAWAKLPHAMDILTQEPDQSINWASCILDLMLNGINEEKLGIALNSSVCDKNPDPQYVFEEEEDPILSVVEV